MPRRNRRRSLLAVLSVALLGLTACAPGATVDHEATPQVDGTLPAEMREELQAAVETAMAATGSTGAIVEVRAPWSGVWTAALGTSTPGGAPVAIDMRFKAGPVTRMMTCDALYGMAHHGIVAVDDPLGRWLSGYPSVADVTLGQLCESTSGIGSYAPLVNDRWIKVPERTWAPKELIAYGFAKGLQAEPGVAYRDSDTGYLLLGLALQRASDTPAARLLDEYVFEPIGMDDTSLPDRLSNAAELLGGLRSSGRTPDCTEPTNMTRLSPTAGFTASGVISTVDDLSDYIQSVALGTRSYDAEARFADPLPAAADGPSWFTAAGGAMQAGSLVGQAGSVPGYLTAAFADRETGLSVVLVLNNSRAGASVPRDLAWQLAAIASKAPAAAGESMPEAGGLPWKADTYGEKIVDAAICPLP